MYLTIIFGPLFSWILIVSFLNSLKKIASLFLIFLSLFMSLFFVILAVYEVVYLNSFCLIELNSWFKFGILNVTWSFYFDKLTISMLLLIILISTLVHIFAYDYLGTDPHLLSSSSY